MVEDDGFGYGRFEGAIGGGGNPVHQLTVAKEVEQPHRYGFQISSFGSVPKPSTNTLMNPMYTHQVRRGVYILMNPMYAHQVRRGVYILMNPMYAHQVRRGVY